MKLSPQLNIFALAFAFVLLTACASDGDDQLDPRGDGGNNNDVVTEGQGMDTGNPVYDSPFDDPSNPLSTMVIYFDYDSAKVRDRDMTVVNAHARYLADNPGAKIRLEGHADERGSREYNVALSENRAQSVQRLMAFRGATNAQSHVVAFGEERPVEFCQAERCWGKNRRVEIVYEAK